MSILKPTTYQVTEEGTLVKLQLGNVPIKMDYRTALDIAQRLRIVGRRAKAMSGDTSMNLTALGLLTDAESDELQRQSQREY